VKVKLVFESDGPYLDVVAESDDESQMLQTAFGGCELRGEFNYKRKYGGGGYSIGEDRPASLRVSLFTSPK
jgi:hypothetical protein